MKANRALRNAASWIVSVSKIPSREVFRILGRAEPFVIACRNMVSWRFTSQTSTVCPFAFASASGNLYDRSLGLTNVFVGSFRTSNKGKWLNLYPFAIRVSILTFICKGILTSVRIVCIKEGHFEQFIVEELVRQGIPRRLIWCFEPLIGFKTIKHENYDRFGDWSADWEGISVSFQLVNNSYLVDPASSDMLVSKIKPCMSKNKRTYSVNLRMAH